MRIDAGNPLLETQAPTIDRTPSQSAANSAQTGGVRNSDEASFSAGNTISTLASQLEGLPDVRQDRVAALKQAIETGQYRVSDAQIAGALQAQLLPTGSSDQ
jgi:flagellar biosynthesis anti-sigma factor FlgM